MFHLHWLLRLYLFVFSVEALFIWKPSEDTLRKQAKLQKHETSVGHYVDYAFSFTGPKIDTVTQNTLPSLKIKRRQLPKRSNVHKIATSVSPTQANSLAIDQDGTDYSYFSGINFGSSDETLWMLMDTGATNTWVMGSDCTSDACSTHNTFGVDNSDTLKVSQKTFSLSYGTGSVNGVLVSDTISFAGKSVSMSFGSASNTSDDFNNYPMDGILGLGRTGANQMGVSTFLETVNNANLFSTNLFGVNLNREVDGNADGEINFGSPDTAKYVGDLTYTAVSNKEFWQIPVDDVIVNGVPCKVTGNTAIIDTGTTYMLLPPNDAKQIHTQISGSKLTGELYNFPCTTTDLVQIVFSGKSFDISPKDYVGRSVTGTDLCVSNIISSQALGSDEWLVGDTFLKNVYSVFDLDKGRIGFGAKSPSGNSGISSSYKASPSTSSLPSSATSTGASLGASTSPSSTDPSQATSLSTKTTILASTTPNSSSPSKGSSVAPPSKGSHPPVSNGTAEADTTTLVNATPSTIVVATPPNDASSTASFGDRRAWLLCYLAISCISLCI